MRQAQGVQRRRSKVWNRSLNRLQREFRHAYCKRDDSWLGEQLDTGKPPLAAL
jgi:hypothetical protein